MPHASLNYLERNRIVAALRAGKSWDEATAFVPRNIDRATLAEVWKESLTAEAKQDAVTDPKPVRLDPEEFTRLKAENENLRAKLEKFNADLSAVRQENEALKEIHANGKKK